MARERSIKMVKPNGLGFQKNNKAASLGSKFSWQEIAKLFATRVGMQNNKEYIQWLESKEDINEGHPLFNAETYFFCYKVYKKINFTDNDHCTVIVGQEGSGKSTLAFQLAAVVSPSFCMKNILYEPDEFFKAIEESERGQTIVVDEGVLFMFAREAASSTNKDVIKLFMLLRQKNLHLIIVIPEFKAIEPYVRQHRADTLFNIFEKGTFDAFNHDAIKIINDVYPKTKSILKAVHVPLQYQWQSRFNKPFPKINDISRQKYVEIKAKNLSDVLGRLRAKFGGKAGRQSYTPNKGGKDNIIDE